MYYKDIMEICLKENFIDDTTPIKEALSLIQNSSLNAAIVKNNDKKKILGIISKEELINAYGGCISPYEPVYRIINTNYVQVNMDTKVDAFILEKPFVIVTDHHNNITGIVSETILSRKLLKLSLDQIKKTATKKLLHQDEESDLEMPKVNNNYFIDFYNRINKLIYVNRELWDIIEYSSDSIYVTDGNGITVYANDSFERMTGAPVSSVLGLSVFEIESQGIYKPSISAIVLKEKRPVTLIQKGYNGKDLIVTGVPVFDVDGNIYMVICNTKDIDELSILKNYLLDIKSTSVKMSNESNHLSTIIYTSENMINLMTMISKVTHVDSTVLITGESGTGKGLIARYIHDNSKRSGEKLIEINCSAIPEALFESELFGYESGAFTGAKKGGKPGMIEMANKGTLFLDEIGDMPMHMQVKLLKVLQDRQVTRVGAVSPIDIDIRIIAATNKDLKQLVSKELFRADLYYRLNVFPVHLSPLRERKEDIYTLLQHYLTYYNKKHNGNVTLTHQAQEILSNYNWPGNVRELDHFVERLVLIKDGLVDIDDLDMDLDMDYNISPKEETLIVNKLLPLKKAIDETERQLINMATEISQNSYDVAELLEISQASAYRKIKKYKW